jgi:hypothetical protein
MPTVLGISRYSLCAAKPNLVHHLLLSQRVPSSALEQYDINPTYLESERVCGCSSHIVPGGMEQRKTHQSEYVLDIDKMSLSTIATTSSEDKMTYLYCREIIMSPFWLRTIIMEIMAALSSHTHWRATKDDKLPGRRLGSRAKLPRCGFCQLLATCKQRKVLHGHPFGTRGELDGAPQ